MAFFPLGPAYGGIIREFSAAPYTTYASSQTLVQSCPAKNRLIYEAVTVSAEGLEFGLDGSSPCCACAAPSLPTGVSTLLFVPGTLGRNPRFRDPSPCLREDVE